MKAIKERTLLAKAILTFGADKQELMAIEEMAELTQAILHQRRGRPNNVAEEIADVEIMLEQLKMINMCEYQTETIKVKKLNRLANRLGLNDYEITGG